MEPASVRLEGIEKRYGDGPPAVVGLDLEIGRGEFFSLLGPSGCGKTTTLMLLAGFEQPTAGRILVGGEDVTDLPPHRRGMGVVFQSYALFPHRTVFENVAFGLRMRRVPGNRLHERVRAALRMVELDQLADRYPHQLSGGQQQRVALARAVVVEPRMLLMDEPLGALDKRLRRSMQFELKALHRRLGVTLVYVTHDQEEALSMSDRIAVMRDGRIEQAGTPEALYARPRTAFTADFLGDANLFAGTVAQGPDGPVLVTGKGERVPAPRGTTTGDRLVIAVRPENIRLVAPPTGLSARIVQCNFLGAAVLLQLATASGATVIARAPLDALGGLAPDAAVAITWDRTHAVPLAD